MKATLECGLIFYAGRLIDLMSKSGPLRFWAFHKEELCIVIGVVLIVRPLLIALNHLLLDQTLGSNLQDQVRWNAHRHVLGQSSAYFQREFSGRITNRVVQLGQAVEQIFYSTFEALWFGLTYITAAIIILGEIDYRVGLALAIWLALYAIYVRRMALQMTRASKDWSDERSSLTGKIVDTYSNIETVKLFATGDREEAFALIALQDLRRRAQNFRRLITKLAFGLNTLNGIMLIGVIGPSVWLWTLEAMSVGQVAAAIALTLRLNGMSGWIMGVITQLFENFGAIQDGLQSLSEPHQITDTRSSKSLSVSNGELRLEGITHRYGKPAGGVENINITIQGGQHVGLVGMSGAGKSTLINLILRFWDPEKGTILIDDQPISKVSQESLRKNIGLVSQTTALLHRSMRENLLYANPSATESDIVEAARRAKAHEFIVDLVDPEGRRGYDACVGERGVMLSGGQCQRIAIARAILKDAPILILDEATSALDSKTEAEILPALYESMKGKTVIAIAHRLQTLEKMDRVIVLHRGKIVEDGRHEDLLLVDGYYSKQWLRQSVRAGFV